MMRASHLVRASLIVAVLGASAAYASDVSYSVSLQAGEKLSGSADVDDSSGDVNSISGAGIGPVTGDFKVDRVTPTAVLTGKGAKVEVKFDRLNQALNARYDFCPERPESCTVGEWIVVWQK